MFFKDHLKIVTDAGAVLHLGWDYDIPYFLDPLNGIDVDLKTAQGFSPHTRGLQKRTTGATESEMIFLERRTLQFYRPPRLRSRIPASDRVRA